MVTACGSVTLGTVCGSVTLLTVCEWWGSLGCECVSGSECVETPEFGAETPEFGVETPEFGVETPEFGVKTSEFERRLEPARAATAAVTAETVALPAGVLLCVGRGRAAGERDGGRGGGMEEVEE